MDGFFLNVEERKKEESSHFYFHETWSLGHREKESPPSLSPLMSNFLSCFLFLSSLSPLILLSLSSASFTVLSFKRLIKYATG